MDKVLQTMAPFASLGGMEIPLLGPLRPEPRWPTMFVSEPVPLPYFDGRALKFTLADLTEDDLPEARSAVEAFLAMGPEQRLAAGPYVFANYRRMVEAIGEEEMGCQVESDQMIWGHVHPSEILVSRRHRRDCLIYVQISAECDWEPEHGLQIVYRRGNELSRVSSQDGHLTYADAYDVPEDQDRIV